MLTILCFANIEIYLKNSKKCRKKIVVLFKKDEKINNFPEIAYTYFKFY